MDISVAAFVANCAIFTCAGLLTGYMLGKDEGYKQGVRRGRAITNMVREMKK